MVTVTGHWAWAATLGAVSALAVACQQLSTHLYFQHLTRGSEAEIKKASSEIKCGRDFRNQSHLMWILFTLHGWWSLFCSCWCWMECIDIISLFVTFKFFIWSVCSISESAIQNYRYCWYQSAIAGKQSKINVFLSLELVKCDYNLSWIAEYHKTLQQHSAEIESFISVNSTRDPILQYLSCWSFKHLNIAISSILWIF